MKIDIAEWNLVFNFAKYPCRKYDLPIVALLENLKPIDPPEDFQKVATMPRRPYLKRKCNMPPTPPYCAEGTPNLPTSLLAETLTNHMEVWRLLRAANAFRKSGSAFVKAFQSAVEPYVHSYRPPILTDDVKLADIDWGVIAGFFEAENAPFSLTVETPAISDNPNLMRPVPANALGILRASTFEGNVLKLPAGQLDRKLYESVAEVLASLGGKWVGRKTQGHVFDAQDISNAQDAIASGYFLRPKDVGFFPTPDDLADDLVSSAEIGRGMTVLEPSAGRGALALRAATWTESIDNVTVCELLEGNARKLREAGFKNVHQKDFLTFETDQRFDRVVMNPPFSGGADIDHFMHAAKMVDPCGRIAAIMSTSWQHHSGKKATAFRELMEQCDALLSQIPAGAFKSSGTQVPTVVVVVDAVNFPWNDAARDSVRPMLRERA